MADRNEAMAAPTTICGEAALHHKELRKKFKGRNHITVQEWGDGRQPT
jgi:hypothetical protein